MPGQYFSGDGCPGNNCPGDICIGNICQGVMCLRNIFHVTDVLVIFIKVKDAWAIFAILGQVVYALVIFIKVTDAQVIFLSR